VYLQTVDAVGFYKKLGFVEQPKGMRLIVGEYLQNETRDAEPPSVQTRDGDRAFARSRIDERQ